VWLFSAAHDHHHFAMLTQVHPAQKHTHQIDLESLDHFNAGVTHYIAYTGSMNMVDPRYFKQDSGVGQWIDLMARMASNGMILTSGGGGRIRFPVSISQSQE
jgi:hypothetical protein